MSDVERFLRDIDARWRVAQDAPIALHILGASALGLQTNHLRGTKDSDILETADITNQVRDALLSLAGPQTELHRKHRMYIELVPQGLPFLPRRPTWNDIPQINQALVHFQVHALDVIDVVVSKIFRFNPDDQSDINAMINAELVPHARLIERFRDAFDGFLYDSRVQQLRACVTNLHAVERDAYGTAATEFQIPDWTDR